MAISDLTGQIISSSTYNAIRGRVNRVLGIGNGADQGYGVTLSSVSRGDNSLITSEDMLALYNDIVKGRTHQKGSIDLQWTNTAGLNPPSDDDLIGYYAAAAFDLTTQPTNTYILYWNNTQDPNRSISLYNPTVTGTGIQLRVVHIGRIYEVTILQNGTGFAINNTINIPGIFIGGYEPRNNLTITVLNVNTDGGITVVSATGEANPIQSSVYATNNANEGFQDFIDASNDLEADKDLVGAGQTSISVKSYSRRVTSWFSAIDHIVRVEWADANARRYFFNTGGEIRFNANLTGGLANPNSVGTAAPPSVKDEIWQSMLGNMGTILFTKYRTYSTGSEGSDYGFGNYSGSQSVDWSQSSLINPVKIFSQPGVGIYSENEYYILAYQDAANSLIFNIIFNDRDLGDQNGVGSAVDEAVTGIVESTVSTKTATGALGIPEPTVFLQSPL